MSDQMQTKRKRKEHIIDGKCGRTQVAEEKPFDKKKKAKDKTASPPNKQKQKKAEQSESIEYDSSCSTIATSNTKRQSTQEKFGQSKTKPSYSTWKNNQSSQKKQCNVRTFPANATGEGRMCGRVHVHTQHPPAPMYQYVTLYIYIYVQLCASIACCGCVCGGCVYARGVACDCGGFLSPFELC